MYPKRKAKSDRERFLESFKKKVGCAPEVYVRRKLASGMNEEELSKLYDMLAIPKIGKIHKAINSINDKYGPDTLTVINCNYCDVQDSNKNSSYIYKARNGTVIWEQEEK